MIIAKKPLGVIKPSSALRKLAILSEIGANPKISQRKLASLVSITSTMVNNYLRDFTNMNLIRVKGETNRSFEYHLTTKGVKEKGKLMQESWIELVQIYGIIKNELRFKLIKMKENGVNNIALFGAAETGELAYIVGKHIGLNIQNIFDSDPSKCGRQFLEITIQHPQEILKLKYNDILITSMGHTNEIFQQIKTIRKDIIIHTLTENEETQ